MSNCFPNNIKMLYTFVILLTSVKVMLGKTSVGLSEHELRHWQQTVLVAMYSTMTVICGHEFEGEKTPKHWFHFHFIFKNNPWRNSKNLIESNLYSWVNVLKLCDEMRGIYKALLLWCMTVVSMKSTHAIVWWTSHLLLHWNTIFT